MAYLFWVTPNVRGRGWRWVTPGGFLALLIWLAVSAGFTVYESGFSSYNKACRTHAMTTARRDARKTQVGTDPRALAGPSPTSYCARLPTRRES
ncbi:YhjD/YihY/BrkB family envelope integrity protein [Streptomyces sp. NPDC046925]|uniref:YhjD/YihY/BrkB family envelope integrity protein n=1 Tax=Streptomyces sp. NPDC046925 TaxID=3155375 RepID=UPI0033F25AF7